MPNSSQRSQRPKLHPAAWAGLCAALAVPALLLASRFVGSGRPAPQRIVGQGEPALVAAPDEPSLVAASPQEECPACNPPQRAAALAQGSPPAAEAADAVLVSAVAATGEAAPPGEQPDELNPAARPRLLRTVPPRVYDNTLRLIEDPRPILTDWPQFVEPVVEVRRFEAAPVVDDPDGDLEVRAWRYSYNARGIIEMPNRLRGLETAVIVVHPWGIEDERGWVEAEPAGVALNCTPEKNRVYHQHLELVLNPLLQRLRPRVGLVCYSLPGSEDPIRRQLYRSVRGRPSDEDRSLGEQSLRATLSGFRYQGSPIETQFVLNAASATAGYFEQFPGLDASSKFNGEGFWELPIPVSTYIDVAPDDVVIYDAEGYALLRDFLREQGIRNVILCGYNADMCVCRTTAGYENLAPDFNLFLVGDATIATFPANATPRFATNAAVSLAALRVLVTQASWIDAGEPPAPR